MRGKKERLERIAIERDIDALKAMRDILHIMADIAAAALRDDARWWANYCDCEAACARRIKELEGVTK